MKLKDGGAASCKTLNSWSQQNLTMNTSNHYIRCHPTIPGSMIEKMYLNEGLNVKKCYELYTEWAKEDIRKDRRDIECR